MPLSSQFGDMAQRPQGFSAPKAGLDDEIRAAAFFRIRHLAVSDIGKPLFGHSRAAHHPLRLNEGGRGNENDQVAITFAPHLEKQRNIQYGEFFAARDAPVQKSPGLTANKGMDDCFQPAERVGVMKHEIAQSGAVYRAIADRVRESLADRSDRRAAAGEQLVDGGVGIVDRQTHPGKRFCCCRFAHADGAGKSNHDHCRRSIPLKVLQHEFPKAFIDFRLDTEPGLETGTGLMQQHPQPIHHAIAALPGCSQ